MSHGYLGIDLGTQGLSIIFTNSDLQVLATGEAGYDMVPNLPPGCYEQNPADWEHALQVAMADLRQKLAAINVKLNVAAIGISGQMHGEVQVMDEAGTARSTRLWCDARNEAEEAELTRVLQTKMPKRMTAVRWLWSLRNRPSVARETVNLTTPGGWLAQRLTGQRLLGIGDASGMFPVDQQTLDYDSNYLAQYDQLVRSLNLDTPPLRSLLPNVRCAGQDGGTLNSHGAQLLGLPVGTPVAPAEGDQPAALAGSLIGRAGMVSMSFGTSVCANSVGDRAFQGVSRSVDHFCAPDGKPINMIWLRNGTTFMNSVVQMVGSVGTIDGESAFRHVIPALLNAADDCGGLLALPFMDDEPGVGVSRGGTGLLVGLNSENATPGNAARAALLATVFNLRIGSDVLEAQRYPLNHIILSGGLTKSPDLGQVIADGFGLPVTILDSGSEGSAWGAALMAKYRHQAIDGSTQPWDEFLEQHASGQPRHFNPNPTAAPAIERMYARYQKLLATHSELERALSCEP